MNKKTKEPEDPCPECNGTDTTVAVRLYPARPGVVDVGYKCLGCGHEWGFALS